MFTLCHGRARGALISGSGASSFALSLTVPSPTFPLMSVGLEFDVFHSSSSVKYRSLQVVVKSISV
jgi:hypothetical protein